MSPGLCRFIADGGGRPLCQHIPFDLGLWGDPLRKGDLLSFLSYACHGAAKYVGNSQWGDGELEAAGKSEDPHGETKCTGDPGKMGQQPKFIYPERKPSLGWTYVSVFTPLGYSRL